MTTYTIECPYCHNESTISGRETEMIPTCCTFCGKFFNVLAMTSSIVQQQQPSKQPIQREIIYVNQPPAVNSGFSWFLFIPIGAIIMWLSASTPGCSEYENNKRNLQTLQDEGFSIPTDLKEKYEINPWPQAGHRVN